MGRVTGRLRGVDVARAVALIGMMGTHLLPEYDAHGRLTPWFWFAAGRSSALFALLAGVGLALATGGSEPRLLPWRATATRHRRPGRCSSQRSAWRWCGSTHRSP